MTEQEFINHPDTADFVMKRSIDFENFTKNHPEILMTEQILLGQYVVGYANKKDIDVIIKEFGSSFIGAASMVMGLLDRPSLEASGIIQVQKQHYLNLRGQGVIIAFIDTGIDYTKDIFIYEDGTSKIQFIYDQTVPGHPPAGLLFGTEYTNEQINQALRSGDPYSIVAHRDTVGHGTFLASVAAGRNVGDFIGAAPDAELIVVKLRKARNYYLDLFAVPPEQENAFESNHVIAGIEFVIARARQLGRPVVICLGVGTNFGSHDGFGLFPEYLQNVSNLTGVCLCTSAGNESQARHHTQGKLISQGEDQTIDIKVGASSVSTLISIWSSAADRVSLSVRSPTGELVSRVPAKSGTREMFPLILEKASVGVSYFFPVEGNGAQFSAVRLLNPTPGIWTIIVHGDIVLDGTYNTWLPMTGFVSPEIEFLTASPYTTIVVPATMFGSIVCGAYDPSENSLFTKSSWGPTRTPTMSPDLVAPGVNVGGLYPQGYGRMDGTSAAAAITSGACALLMQWGVVNGNNPAMSTYQIRAFLLRGCDRSDAMTYPNEKWGYGSLNLIQTFNLMREL
jgi:subtilisin family serine protease